MKTINNVLSGIVLMLFLSGMASASVSSDLNKFDKVSNADFKVMDKHAKSDFHAYKSMIKNNPEKFPPHLSGIIVLSNSANFENSNVVRACKIQDENWLDVFDLNGNVEHLKVSSIHKYECHVFFNDGNIPSNLDTSGSLSSNWDEFEA